MQRIIFKKKGGGGRSSYSLFAYVHFRISKIISNLKITKIGIFSSPFSQSNSTKRKILLFNSWYVTENRFFYENDVINNEMQTFIRKQSELSANL